MKPGMRTSSFPGDAADALLELSVAPTAGGAAAVVRFRPTTGYGDRRYAAYVNGRRATTVFVAEGQTGRAALMSPADAAGRFSLLLEDLGDWEDAAYDPEFVALRFEEETATGLRWEWAATPELLCRGDTQAQFSSWTLSGLKRFSNCAVVPGRPTRGRLEVRLSDAAGVRTVSLYAGRALVARGSRTGDGSVTLTARNDSGLSGFVNVSYSTEVGAGEVFLAARWPGSHQVHYSPSGLSFPRTPEAVVADDGSGNLFHYASGPLPAGNYYAAVLPVSDTGQAAAGATAQTAAVVGPPAPPTGLAYQSGDAAATVIKWTASATPGATYNLYDSPLDGVTDLSAPGATHSAGSGELTQTLPAATGFPGVRRVLVRAVAGGVEEKNAALLEIEYDAAGNRVPPRPNPPRLCGLSVSAGRTVMVEATTFDADEKAAPATAELYLARLTDAFDYEAPAAAAAWGEPAGGVRRATLAAVATADGWWKAAVRAKASDGTPDLGTAWERVYVSAGEPPAETEVLVLPARS